MPFVRIYVSAGTEDHDMLEIEDVIDESIDCDGFVFTAFRNLVAEVVGEIMSETKYEQFEKDCKKYRKKLKTIEGLYVDDSIIYDDYGYESVNGINAYTDLDDESTIEIESYIEWSEERGWSYFVRVGEIGDSKHYEFANIDDLVNCIKNNIKVEELV